MHYKFLAHCCALAMLVDETKRRFRSFPTICSYSLSIKTNLASFFLVRCFFTLFFVSKFLLLFSLNVYECSQNTCQ